MNSSFKRTAKQVDAMELMASTARHVMVYGGSRSGKTFAFIRALIIRAIKTKSRHVVLRLNFNHAKTSIWLDTLPKVLFLCFPEMPVVFNKSDYYITLLNGSEIWVGGLDDDKRVEKILGKEYSTIFFNECSQIPYSSIQVALTRLAEKNKLKKKAFYDENPPSKKHWSYWLFIKKLDPISNEPVKKPNDYASMVINPFDNLENIDEEYIQMLEQLPEKDRERFLYGRFTDDSDGMTYYSFDREKHVREIEKGPGSILLGFDFNVDPMTAVVCQYWNERFHIVDEMFLNNSDTYKAADYLIKKKYIGDVYPDSTGKNRKTSGISDHKILRDSGFVIKSTRNPFVTDRVNNINRLLQDDRIIIDPKCKKLINDLERVSWKDNKLDQKSDTYLTHISDALGYLCWGVSPLRTIKKSTFHKY
jgi:PBSX family phage terminase large subunit